MINNQKPITILHLAPHTGGGVGTVLRSIIKNSNFEGGYTHSLATLEPLNDLMRTWCIENRFHYFDNCWNNKTHLYTLLENCDIVHIHWWNHPLLHAFLSARLLPEMRTILWSHVNGMFAPQIFFRPIIDFPDLFVLATPYSKEALFITTDCKKIKTHIRTIQSNAGTPPNLPGKRHKPEQLRVGYIGTVDYSKMHKDFISIWNEAAIIDSPLLVCGGPYNVEFKKEVSERGIAHLFDIRGVVNNVFELLPDLHIFMYPLNNTHYGTGEQILLEAMACGAVPVVMNNGCERILIKDGKTGIIAHNKYEFVQALQFLENNPQIREKMAAAGKDYVESQFKIQTTVQKWHRLYEETLTLKKRKHCLELLPIDKIPINSTTSLLLNSYGNSLEAHQLLSYITSDKRLEDIDLSKLPPAFFAQTRGSPFHYRKALPGDPLLNKICQALQQIKQRKNFKKKIPDNSMRLCPICSGNKITKISSLNYALFDDLNLSGNMILAECENCRIIFNSSELKDSDFARYYRLNEYYLDSRSPGSGGNSKDDNKRYSIIHKRLKKYISNTEPIILDFGCGKGGMLKWLNDNTKAILVGIEKSAACRAFVKKNLSILVFQSLAEIDKKVDLVILSHILEHIYSPVKLIEELKKISHASTVFYIEVPRAEAYISANIKWQELYFEHINHFSEAGLSYLLNSNGLEILKKGTTCFYPDDLNSSKCQYSIAKTGKIKQLNKPFISYSGNTKKHNLPAQETISKIIKEKNPVSIWGISQYTQLVLGCYPDLFKRIKNLFDSSPAKTGRTIRGIKIKSSNELSILGAEDILLIPASPYSKEMREILTNINFTGKVIMF